MVDLLFVFRDDDGTIGSVELAGAVAGAVTAVSHRISERHARKSQQQAADQPRHAAPASAPPPPPAAQPPATAPGTDALGVELKRLADMHAQGLITDDEFAAAKAKALGI